MKLKHIFTALLATLAIATACEDNLERYLDEVKVSSSYVAIPANGGSQSITVTANDSWSFQEIPDWVTVSPASGAAGESKVTFTASETSSTKEAVLKLSCGGKTQLVTVLQMTAKVDLPITSCLDLNTKGEDGKSYRVKGVVTKIVNTTYGNLYIDDGSGAEAYVYGTLDKAGAEKNFLSLGIEVGDEVTVEGPRTTYNGVVELVNVTVIDIQKSLIKIDSVEPESAELPLEGGDLVVNLTCKGEGISVAIPEDIKSWLSVSSINISGKTGIVTLTAAPNTQGDRSATVEFKTVSGGKTYAAQTTLLQKGAILSVSIKEFNEAPVGETVYRISGFVTRVKSDGDKYGANLYIKDASGETYIYGTTNAEGAVKSIASMNIKEGDIVEFLGKRAEYKGEPQMSKAAVQWSKPVTVMTAAEAAALPDDNKNDVQNYIKLTGKVTTAGNGNKTDLVNYGNFDLVDASGTIYIYGVSTGWNGATKQFSSLGVKEGDTITVVGYKTSYKSKPQVVGMYVSHEAAK